MVDRLSIFPAQCWLNDCAADDDVDTADLLSNWFYKYFAFICWSSRLPSPPLTSGEGSKGSELKSMCSQAAVTWLQRLVKVALMSFLYASLNPRQPQHSTPRHNAPMLQQHETSINPLLVSSVHIQLGLAQAFGFGFDVC